MLRKKRINPKQASKQENGNQWAVLLKSKMDKVLIGKVL